MSFNLFKRKQQVDPDALMAARQEMELLSYLYNNIIESCYNKCISTKYVDPELNKAESVCIDRCVAKYIQTNMNAGKEFSAHMMQQQNMNR